MIIVSYRFPQIVLSYFSLFSDLALPVLFPYMRFPSIIREFRLLLLNKLILKYCCCEIIEYQDTRVRNERLLPVGYSGLD